MQIYAIAQSLAHFYIYYFVHPLFFFDCTFLLYRIVLYSTSNRSDVTDVENMAYPTTSISTSFSHSLKWHTSQQKITYIYFQNLVILSSDIHSTKNNFIFNYKRGPLTCYKNILEMKVLYKNYTHGRKP